MPPFLSALKSPLHLNTWLALLSHLHDPEHTQDSGKKVPGYSLKPRSWDFGFCEVFHMKVLPLSGSV
jgi:hypothetical protein